MYNMQVDITFRKIEWQFVESKNYNRHFTNRNESSKTKNQILFGKIYQP